jgi:rhodanese-related sulfurtransferase
MTLKDIDVIEAQTLLQKDAVLVDVREPHELAVERIPGSIELPLSALVRGQPADLPQDKPVVFHCASGGRTKNNAAALASLTNGNAYNMVGGIIGWKRAGFPTTRG